MRHYRSGQTHSGIKLINSISADSLATFCARLSARIHIVFMEGEFKMSVPLQCQRMAWNTNMSIILRNNSALKGLICAMRNRVVTFRRYKVRLTRVQKCRVDIWYTLAPVHNQIIITRNLNFIPIECFLLSIKGGFTDCQIKHVCVRPRGCSARVRDKGSKW